MHDFFEAFMCLKIDVQNMFNAFNLTVVIETYAWVFGLPYVQKQINMYVENKFFSNAYEFKKC